MSQADIENYNNNFIWILHFVSNQNLQETLNSTQVSQSIGSNQRAQLQLFCVRLKRVLYEASQQICKKLEKQASECCAVLYNLRGLPLVSNLNELHLIQIQKAFKTISVKTVNVILTRTAAGEKTRPKLNSEEGKDQIFIIHQGSKLLKVEIDKDTVLQLKQKIYDKLNIPTIVQAMKFQSQLTIGLCRELQWQFILPNKVNLDQGNFGHVLASVSLYNFQAQIKIQEQLLKKDFQDYF